MPGNAPARRTGTPHWLWALLPMLLAAALVAPVLNRDVFDVDEASTMIGVGARHLGPYSIFEAVDRSVSRWPGVGLGHVLAHVLWGRLTGWSELAVRALPWFLGLLSLAWIFRTGRDLFNSRVALAATLFLSTSVLFLTYMHVARSYAAAILFAAVTLWGYWRVALDTRPAGPGARLAMLTGATGLLYSHYFAALLLPSLALFHLLFQRWNRRWLLPVFLLGLAFLCASPQFHDLLSGIDANLGRETLHGKALRGPQVLSLFLRHLSNDLFNPREPFGSGLVIVPGISFLAFIVWHWRKRNQTPGPASYLALVSGFNLLLLLLANEWLQVLESRRIRYLASLWPSALLLLGLATHFLNRRLLRYSGWLLVAATTLFGASEFLQNGDLVQHSWAWKKHPVSIPVTRLLASPDSDYNLLLVDADAFRYENRSYEFYTGIWGDRRFILRPNSDSDRLLELAWSHDRVWLLYRKSDIEWLNIETHLDLLEQEGWFLHSSWQDEQVVLLKYDSPLLAGLVDGSGLEFEQDIRMTGLVVERPGHDLVVRVGLQSADDYLLSHYSLAVHVIDPRTGERVAQGDVGVGPGTFVPVLSNTDTSALPAGDYEVHVALYDWQTGERLNARDLQTDAVSDMHVLHRFRIP